MSKVIFGALLAFVAVCSPALAQQCCENQGVIYMDNAPMVMESYGESFVVESGMIEGQIVEIGQPMFVSEMPVYENSFVHEPVVESFVETPVVSETPVFWYGDSMDNCCCQSSGGVYYVDATPLQENVVYGGEVAYFGEAINYGAETMTFEAPFVTNVIEGEVVDVAETFTNTTATDEPSGESEEVIEEAAEGIVEDAEEETAIDGEVETVDSEDELDDEESGDDEELEEDESEDDDVFGDDGSSDDE